MLAPQLAGFRDSGTYQPEQHALLISVLQVLGQRQMDRREFTHALPAAVSPPRVRQARQQRRRAIAAARLDHVVDGDGEVGGAILDHLENSLQQANNRAVRAVLAFGEPAQAVEVTEEFVSAVDEVNDHLGSMLDTVAVRSKTVGQGRQMYTHDPPHSDRTHAGCRKCINA